MTKDLIFQFLKIYLWGIIILISAILFNLISSYLKVSNWYSFLNQAREIGFIQSLSQQNLFSLIFLFLIYPLLLGLAVFLIVSYLIK